jgi:hypothetical protein
MQTNVPKNVLIRFVQSRRLVCVLFMTPGPQSPGKSSLDLGGGVLLVGGDGLAVFDLLVGVRRPDNELLLVIDNGKGGEAVAGAPGAVPARGDGVGAAGDGATGGLGGLLVLGGLDGELASSGLGAVVDAKVPVARGVGGVAGALDALNGPLSVGHHGDAGGGSRSGEGTAGGEEGSDEEAGDLHGD